MNKIKLAILVATLAVTGCSTHKPPPVDVQLIPNDCANQRLIINYLNQEANRERGTFESERDHERYRAEMRRRVWTMRYNCNPV